MDLKKILNETADRLESGALRWTKDSYILVDGEELPMEDTFDPHNVPLDTCEVCAVGGCALVGMLNGEISAYSFDNAVSQFESALNVAISYTKGSGELIIFNDRFALSAKSVAEKLRAKAAELP